MAHKVDNYQATNNWGIAFGQWTGSVWRIHTDNWTTHNRLSTKKSSISAKDAELLRYYAMPASKFPNQYRVTSQNTRTFSNSAVRSSSLAIILGAGNNATTNHFNVMCITFSIQDYVSIFSSRRYGEHEFAKCRFLGQWWLIKGTKIA